MTALISTFSDTRLSSPGDIFYGTPESLMTTPIIIASGQSLTRGAALGKQTADGKYYLLDKTASDGTETLVGILVDAVDASSGDADGEMYIAGKYNLSQLPNISNYASSPLTTGIYYNGNIIIQEAVI